MRLAPAPPAHHAESAAQGFFKLRVGEAVREHSFERFSAFAIPAAFSP